MSVMVPAGDLNLNVVLYILEESVLTEDHLRLKLVESLVKAKIKAKKSLNQRTYDYFTAVYGKAGWPTHIVDYMEYVQMYLTQVPLATFPKANVIMKRINKALQNHGCKRTISYQEYNECVFNDLCHFYWLVNQELADKTTLQQDALFASWIKIFGMGQGVFLNTPASLTKLSLKTFEEDPMYNFSWYNEQVGDWKCFNDLFSRQFNGADSVYGLSPLRPIASGPGVITMPADCTFMHIYEIDDNGNLTDSDGNPATYTLKGFSKGESVGDLLTKECLPFWKDFYGGTFIHYFLSPYDYHRFHVPVAGLVVAVQTITGQNYLKAVITDTGDFDAPDDAEDGYEFRQERGLIIVDNELIGKVATLPIGMAQVSGVHMYKDKLLYRNVVQGQEFGYFLFGGSDIIMLIPKPVSELNIVTTTDGQPTYFHYGQMAAQWPRMLKK